MPSATDLIHNPFEKGDIIVVPQNSPVPHWTVDYFGTNETRGMMSVEVSASATGYVYALRRGKVGMVPPTISFETEDGLEVDIIVTPELCKANNQEIVYGEQESKETW